MEVGEGGVGFAEVEEERGEFWGWGFKGWGHLEASRKAWMKIWATWGTIALP